jgi:hypothetical protein
LLDYIISTRRDKGGKEMSHKVKIHANVDNEVALIQALEEMGYEVRKGPHKLSAFDWTMDCDLSIVKNGKQLNVGFKKVGDKFEMEADWWNTGINPKEFEEQLNVGHGKHKVANWFLEKGYKVSYETAEDGSLVVVGKRWKA